MRPVQAIPPSMNEWSFARAWAREPEERAMDNTNTAPDAELHRVVADAVSRALQAIQQGRESPPGGQG